MLQSGEKNCLVQSNYCGKHFWKLSTPQKLKETKRKNDKKIKQTDEHNKSDKQSKSESSLLVERQALAVRLHLSFRSVYFFFSGNIFPTAEPISTKVCTVTASGQE